MIAKKNIPLIIALAIPILMIVLVAAFIYLPGVGKEPTENFLYSSGGSGYSVQSGVLVPPAHPDYIIAGQPPYQTPQLYIYNVKSNSAEEISYSDAQSLTLDPSQTSADGYTLEQGNGGDGIFPFGGAPDDYNTWYIKGHNRAIKLNLTLSSSLPYSEGVEFLGWIN